MKYNKFLEDLELIDSDHKNFSIETPLRDDAFEINDDEKIKIIEKNVGEILHTLGTVSYTHLTLPTTNSV